MGNGLIGASRRGAHGGDRAVLNCPAHLTHKSTSDLYRAHDIVDPVLKLQKRHANRVKRLLKRHRLSQTGDVALASPALEQVLFLRGQYQSVIAQLDAAATPAAPASLERALPAISNLKLRLACART